MEPDFTGMYYEKTGGNGHKWSQKKFLFDIREKFSTKDIVKCWNRGPECCDATFLGDFQIWADVALSGLMYELNHAFNKGLVQWCPEVSATKIIL